MDEYKKGSLSKTWFLLGVYWQATTPFTNPDQKIEKLPKPSTLSGESHWAQEQVVHSLLR